MFVFGLVVLALFSVISYVLGNADSLREPNPSDDLGYWAYFGHR